MSKWDQDVQGNNSKVEVKMLESMQPGEKFAIVKASGTHNTVVVPKSVNPQDHVNYYNRSGQNTYVGGKNVDVTTFIGGQLTADGGSGGMKELGDVLDYTPSADGMSNLRVTFDKNKRMHIVNVATGVEEVVASNYETLRLNIQTDSKAHIGGTTNFKVEELRAQFNKGGAVNIQFDGQHLSVEGQRVPDSRVIHDHIFYKEAPKR